MDRNPLIILLIMLLMLSLSARRAWIEISGSKRSIPDVDVALRKESVDRNFVA